jgi:actin cytoskeleton-regulatory complex protein PAN1
MAEKILDHINETIRDQEGQETLKEISKHLWIGQGFVLKLADLQILPCIRRLDLTAPTRNMGARRLLKEGTLLKAKSGRKLHALLCSDILVLTDSTVKNLYRMVGSAHLS